MDATNTSIINHVNIEYAKSYFHISCMAALKLLVSESSCSSILPVSFSRCTCLHGCCCSISAAKAVRICGIVLLPCSCPQLSHHSAGEGGTPQFLPFSPSPLPSILSFTLSRSQRQTQARQGN